ncbi:hypothetical protein [Scopulibacillus cellulosilyticus]|uniref:YodL-like protein n=1 Tax=Scopulibacillus cellulosilyticus TaxID=2665665 RepID=A0ABW2PWB4_9BACL
MSYLQKPLFPNRVDPDNDMFLGETFVQIKGWDGYPSVHLVRSYRTISEEAENNYYHIFENRCGAKVINYNKEQYDQVMNYVDISDQWSIFYKEKAGLSPVPKSFRHL